MTTPLEAQTLFEKARTDLAASIPDITGWWWVRRLSDDKLVVVHVTTWEFGGQPFAAVVRTGWPQLPNTIEAALERYEFISKIEEPRLPEKKSC